MDDKMKVADKVRAGGTTLLLINISIGISFIILAGSLPYRVVGEGTCVAIAITGIAFFFIGGAIKKIVNGIAYIVEKTE